MATSRLPLAMDELNKAALDQFVYQPVSRDMIAYLADAARSVITCDPGLVPRHVPPTPPRSPEARPVDADADALPSLDAFITQLVVSSNVQVPTLMSTLVYLRRLKARLQPMARGLRCTTHRIFLASLILAAKYLNDSSPKNKHWAAYTHMRCVPAPAPASDDDAAAVFGFNRTEVNLMEKQLLFLLDWDLRIAERDLYRELDAFLEPLRLRIAERHARRQRQCDEKRRQLDVYAAAARYPSPVSSSSLSSSSMRGSRSRSPVGSAALTPPGLSYSSSASSCASSAASSRQTTPLGPAPPLPCDAPPKALYDSPVRILVDADAPPSAKARMLPYDMPADHHLPPRPPAARPARDRRCQEAAQARHVGTPAGRRRDGPMSLAFSLLLFRHPPQHTQTMA